MGKKKNEYSDTLRRIRSLLLVSTLRERKDLLAFEAIRFLRAKLDWSKRRDLGIDDRSWEYIAEKKYDPKFVFCHPNVLMEEPRASFYYRGLTGLSIKAAKDYVGAVEGIESGKTKIGSSTAHIISRVYNAFICAILKDSGGWTLEDGKRTIIATHGISIDGTMRNKVGKIAEERIRRLLVEWLTQKKLIKTPKELNTDKSPNEFELTNGITMRFGSEPDVSFLKGGELHAILEIKGGIDPAGALERYGAARKSFEHAFAASPRCKAYYLGGVFTPELERRMAQDRLVEKTFDIIRILQEPGYRSEFLKELFHHSLRVI